MSDARPLQDCIAIVTGASRGAGRGIALELGAAGATVYVTGRSLRDAPAPGYERYLATLGIDAPPGSIDETAEEVTRLGGRGIPFRCDHTVYADVQALMRHVEETHRRLDLLVNNAWGAHQEPMDHGPFWQLSLGSWETMFTSGVRNHIYASHAAAPLMIRARNGVIVTVTFWDRWRYTGSLFYDLAKAAMCRLAFDMAQDLHPHGVASVAVSPGWMRTEFILAAYQTDEAHWREVPGLASTETPRYAGRAVAALAADPDIMRKTGSVLRVGDLAMEYGFTDVDGRVIRPFELPPPVAG